MRFKTFLEAQLRPYGHEERPLEDLVRMITTECSQSLRGQQIFRGSKSRLTSGVFDPSSGRRTSANTSNYYTALLDSNPKNDRWPKRSESFIATTVLRTARMYGHSGTVMALFPLNGTKVGVVNEPDMWDTFVDFGPDFDGPGIADMNINWRIILEEIGHEVTPVTPTMDELIGILNRADPAKLCGALVDVDLLRRRTDPGDYARLAKRFAKAVPAAYSYRSLGCGVVTPAKLEGESEVWFSGKCVGLTLDDYDAIKGELE